MLTLPVADNTFVTRCVHRELGTFSGALPVGFASLSKLALLDLSGSDISDVPDAWCSPESSPMWSELLRICHFPTRSVLVPGCLRSTHTSERIAFCRG